MNTLPRAITNKNYLRLVLDSDPPPYRIAHLQRGGWKLARTERLRPTVVVCHFTRSASPRHWRASNQQQPLM
jgi:hypothetical protein